MLGTIICIIGLCIIPMMLSALPLLLLGTNPDSADLPIWFFSSPIFIYGFNEAHEFHAMFRGHWWPRSEYFTLLVNLAIYGTLTLAVRSFVIFRLPAMLNRLDTDTQEWQFR